MFLIHELFEGRKFILTLYTPPSALNSVWCIAGLSEKQQAAIAWDLLEAVRAIPSALYFGFSKETEDLDNLSSFQIPFPGVSKESMLHFHL